MLFHHGITISPISVRITARNIPSFGLDKKVFWAIISYVLDVDAEVILQRDRNKIEVFHFGNWMEVKAKCIYLDLFLVLMNPLGSFSLTHRLISDIKETFKETIISYSFNSVDCFSFISKPTHFFKRAQRNARRRATLLVT